MNKKLTALLASLAAGATAITGFWGEICGPVGLCEEAPTEVVAPAGNTTTTKNVELNGSASADGGGDAKGEIKIDNLSF